ncbi:hypothetical protein [Aporhodopirellula aestuarii]|uniref:Uncharacterized protein n=1 Tax=Aporhodopirellula aestuarii TaxID=2950107 RepID=A0ABT0UFJ7_9BACT|nr:hypothetical protein [Aporhodopirellula aestuarii]MCM2375100.1 hypothetical protein [Aporhodopirellula aestuarii]
MLDRRICIPDIRGTPQAAISTERTGDNTSCVTERAEGPSGDNTPTSQLIAAPTGVNYFVR